MKKNRISKRATKFPKRVKSLVIVVRAGWKNGQETRYVIPCDKAGRKYSGFSMMASQSLSRIFNLPFSYQGM